MFALLFLAFLAVPFLEIVLFTQLAVDHGFGITLLAIVAISLVGAWLVRREGATALRRANQRLAEGEIPTDEIVNGLLILVAGAFMLTPGFITDGLGLLALFPPTRALLRHALIRRFRAHTVVIGFPGAMRGFGTSRGTGGSGPSSGVWDVDGWEDPPSRPEIG